MKKRNETSANRFAPVLLLHRGTWAAILLILLFQSCRTDHSGGALITGQLNGAAGETILLYEIAPRSILKKDSVVADPTGKFRFSPDPSAPGFFLVQAGNGKAVVVPVKNGDTIGLTGDFWDFPDHVILSGPVEALLLDEFFRFTRRNEKTVDSLELVLSGYEEKEDYYLITRSFDTVFQKIWEAQKQYEKDFIDRHADKLSSLIVLNYAFGTATVMDPVGDLAWYRKIDSVLGKLYPDNQHVKYHHERVKALMQGKEN